MFPMGTFLLSEGRRCEGENRPEGRRTDSAKYRRIRHFVIASSRFVPHSCFLQDSTKWPSRQYIVAFLFLGCGKSPPYRRTVQLVRRPRLLHVMHRTDFRKKIRFVIHSGEVKARGPPHYPTSSALVKGDPDCNSVNLGWDRKGVSLMGYLRRIRFDDGPYSSDINLLHSILFSSF